MEAYRPQPNPKNKLSYQQHKQQRFWQITLPVSLAVLLIAVVFALVILTASRGDPKSQVSIWADTSTILLLLPMLLVAVLAAVVLFGLVYLLARLLNILPGYAAVVQTFTGTVADKVRTMSDGIARPFIAVRSFWASTGRLFTGLGRIFRK
ncbi:hypothetical protein KQH62_00220 [bacterium]|nr:hypothetical protein [bacterium]